MNDPIGFRFVVIREQEDHAKDPDFWALPAGPKMAWYMAASAAASCGDKTRLPEGWSRRAEAADHFGLTVADIETAVRLGFLEVDGQDLRILGTGRVFDRASVRESDE